MTSKMKLDLIYASKIWLANGNLDTMRENFPRVISGIEDASFLKTATYKIGFGPVDRISELTSEHLNIIRDIVRFAESRGVTVCLENADKSLGGKPEVIVDLLELMDSEYLKTCYDCGNYAVWEQNPLDALRVLKDRVGYVHLKDLKDGDTNTTWLGNGDIDFAYIFRVLKNNGYSGYACFEFQMSMDRLFEISKSMEYINEFLR